MKISEMTKGAKVLLAVAVAIGVCGVCIDYSYGKDKSSSNPKLAIPVKVTPVKIMKSAAKPNKVVKATKLGHGMYFGDAGPGEHATFGDVTVSTISGDGNGLTNLSLVLGANLDKLALNDAGSLTNYNMGIGSVVQAYSSNLDTLALNNGSALTNLTLVLGANLDKLALNDGGSLTNLVLGIGSVVQAYSSNLDKLALNDAGSLTNYNMGVGSVVQAYSSNLDALALNNGSALTNLFAGGGTFQMGWAGPTCTVYAVSPNGAYTNVIGTYWKE